MLKPQNELVIFNIVKITRHDHGEFKQILPSRCAGCPKSAFYSKDLLSNYLSYYIFSFADSA